MERTARTDWRQLLTRGWSSAVWYVKALLGEDRYRRYLEHQARTHPDAEPLSEGEYWRMVYREQDLNPSGRCC